MIRDNMYCINQSQSSITYFNQSEHCFYLHRLPRMVTLQQLQQGEELGEEATNESHGDGDLVLPPEAGVSLGLS